MTELNAVRLLSAVLTFELLSLCNGAQSSKFVFTLFFYII